MVIEFLANFKEDLSLDCHDFKLVDLQQALESHHANTRISKQIEKLVIDLLNLCIDEPNLIDSDEVQTLNGQKLSEQNLNKYNYSEVLRVYMDTKLSEQNVAIENSVLKEYLLGDCVRLRKICESLCFRQFMCLSPDEKIKLIAYLCNDLLTSKRCCDRIENTLDVLNKSRQEKWHISSKIRSITLQGESIEVS
jgi:hypothetical protein